MYIGCKAKKIIFSFLDPTFIMLQAGILLLHSLKKGNNSIWFLLLKIEKLGYFPFQIAIKLTVQQNLRN